MTYTAKVTRLNSGYNSYTGTTITSFLIENMPATIDAEFQKHGLLSSNSESSRARPSGSVSLQVTSDPYIPNWTLNQKGMSGKYADSATSREAYNLTTRHIRECLTYSRNLTDLGIHKQDINKIALNPFVHNHLIVTATEWDNFLNLRCSPEAHPVMQSIANKIKELLKEESKPYDAESADFYSPYPEETIVQAIAKVASVSYANHAKNRSPEDAEKLVRQLVESKHASPFCMGARPVYPGQLIRHIRLDGSEHTYFIFDNFEKELSSLAYAKYITWGGTAKLLDTDNYHGWVSLRRLEGL